MSDASTSSPIHTTYDASAQPEGHAAWSRGRWALCLGGLTVFAFLVAGWHPYAEDGGMYLTRVLLRLDPSLYPHSRPFVLEPLKISLFEPLLSGVVRIHVPLEWALLLLDVATLALTLLAGLAVLRRITRDDRARFFGVALLAAWATMPVAATSLLLVDPYLTARSFSTPFTLFAAAFALDDWAGRAGRRSALLCLAALAAAFLFHPLMAGYAVAFVVLLRLMRGPRPLLGCGIAAAAGLALAAGVQYSASPASPAALAADASRYYWFLSQWHWYELLGILCPAAILAAFATRPWRGFGPRAQLLARGVLALLAIGVLVELCFAQERFAAHPVARLQPLRVLCTVYALLPLLLGAACVTWALNPAARPRSRVARALPAVMVMLSAAIFFAVQRASFPVSPHVELPGRANHNPWVQAFEWARTNTVPDALFALDARYVNLDGEDAQNFRAISQRSSLPDFSKDGGEAANHPALAALWLPAAEAQQHLSAQSPAQRRAKLKTFAPDWTVLASTAAVDSPCPYDNGTIKVCRFRQ